MLGGASGRMTESVKGYWPPNGLEVREAPLWGSRPPARAKLASHYTGSAGKASVHFSAARRVGSIELLGGNALGRRSISRTGWIVDTAYR